MALVDKGFISLHFLALIYTWHRLTDDTPYQKLRDGTLWAESPLFGQEQLMISGGNDIYLFGIFMIDLMTYFDIF